MNNPSRVNGHDSRRGGGSAGWVDRPYPADQQGADRGGDRDRDRERDRDDNRGSEFVEERSGDRYGDHRDARDDYEEMDDGYSHRQRVSRRDEREPREPRYGGGYRRRQPDTAGRYRARRDFDDRHEDRSLMEVEQRYPAPPERSQRRDEESIRRDRSYDEDGDPREYHDERYSAYDDSSREAPASEWTEGEFRHHRGYAPRRRDRY